MKNNLLQHLQSIENYYILLINVTSVLGRFRADGMGGS